MIFALCHSLPGNISLIFLLFVLLSFTEQSQATEKQEERITRKDDNYNLLWLEWKKLHQKSYLKEDSRFKNWVSNFRKARFQNICINQIILLL